MGVRGLIIRWFVAWFSDDSSASDLEYYFIILGKSTSKYLHQVSTTNLVSHAIQ